MKPGTLVMTKVAGPIAQTYGLRVGSIGEVLERKENMLVEVGRIIVDFPGT